MSGNSNVISRRQMLKYGLGLAGTAALAACGATPTPQVIEKEKVVTQVVEKEVTKVVAGTPQVVKETVVVEKTVQVQVTSAAAPVTLRVAFYVMGESWMKNAEAAIADFMSKNPGVKPVFEWRPGQDYWTKLQTEFAGGTAPDITVNQMNWVIPGAARGMWLDLNPFIERDKFDMSKYFYNMDLEWAWQGGMYGGLLYAGGQTLMVNTTLLKEAGLEMPKEDWTWDDLLTYAKALTNKDKGQYGLMGANDSPPYWIDSFIQANGGDVLNADYNKCTISEPAAVEAVQWVYDLMYKHNVMPTPASIQGQEDPFLSGKVGIAFHGTWYESQVRDAKAFDWDYVRMPLHPSTKKRFAQMGSNTWSILANTKNREESWQFVKFLMDVDGQRWFMKYGIPGIKSLVDSKEYKDMHAPQNIGAVIADMECCGHDYYPTADCDEWWGLIGQEMSAIWSNEIPVKEALANACKAVDEVFARRPPYYEKVKPTPKS